MPARGPLLAIPAVMAKPGGSSLSPCQLTFRQVVQSMLLGGAGGGDGKLLG
jgi:hypothetical protein